MSKIRVLVGTKKGAFILTSDGKRDRWTVDGPISAAGPFTKWYSPDLFRWFQDDGRR